MGLRKRMSQGIRRGGSISVTPVDHETGLGTYLVALLIAAAMVIVLQWS